MNWKLALSVLAILTVGGGTAYYLVESGHDHAATSHDHGAHGDSAPAADPVKGPHHGRLLRDGAFTLELAIFEQGVPPEFRAWFAQDGKSLPPAAVQLTVQLIRPGGVVNDHRFVVEGDYLRSPDEVFEPHSFSYKILARHGDRLHRWEFDAPEMQTTIPAAVAQRAGVHAGPAGPATMTESLAVYGQVRLNANRIARAVPRFAGLVREARKAIGDPVAADEVVAILETNQTLAAIEVKAPIAGTIVDRNVHAGETVAEGATLYLIADLADVWIDLNVPKRDHERVRLGHAVVIETDDGGAPAPGTIAWIAPTASAEAQTLTARVVVPNPGHRWHAGLFVKAEIALAEATVPVAVKESALQTLYSFTVVFSQHGDVYQARPLQLGRRGGGYVEVLKGLAAGERYVMENSFLIKADIGKSAASHDH
ncbi:MAG: efflux RND transporter periplasmic adaptor subunit [Verrucomicrobia bacterium]|nr:efflux RND transporter periplasmic adaptor subunit [Verrucomicrobiota bacterium]